MKKTYVKPVMESEEFVANEYVAACWRITCLNSKQSCGSISGKDAYPSGLTVDENGNGIYIGNIGRTDPGCQSERNYKDYKFDSWEDFFIFLRDVLNNDITNDTVYHPVAVEDGWENHPNASV